MGQPIVVNVDLPADNNDCLAGSTLDPIPEEGVVLLYVASSQRDGVFSAGGAAMVEGGGAVRIPPVLRASGIPDLQSDMPYPVGVKPGKLSLVYDEVTGADAFLTAVFLPAGE